MMLALGLMAVAVLERLVFDLGPNVELVTMASVMAGVYVKGWWRWLVPVGIMALSDVILGVGAISSFTWSGFLATTFIALSLSKNRQSKLLVGTGAGILGTIVFYIWTNFGVWATDSWGMYSHDLNGLWRCYVNGLPFLKTQMASTCLFVPLALVIVEFVHKASNSRVFKESGILNPRAWIKVVNA